MLPNGNNLAMADQDAGTPAGIAMGRRLRAARAALGLGSRELARKAGVEPGLVSKIESGTRHPHRISADVLERLAGALGVTSDFLRTGAAASSAAEILRERSEIVEAIIVAEKLPPLPAHLLRTSYDFGGVSRGRDWLTEYARRLRFDCDFMNAMPSEPEPELRDHELERYIAKRKAQLDKPKKPKSPKKSPPPKKPKGKP